MNTVAPSQTVNVAVANLTSAQAWALRQVIELFADPAHCDQLAGFVAGLSAVHVDNQCGVLRASEVIAIEKEGMSHFHGVN